MLTKRQKEVLDFITEHQKRKGYAPSLEEIRKRFRLASVSTAHFHVAKLQESGYLEKIEKKARAISITKNDSLVRIPLLGTIAAGQPIEAIEEKETIAVSQSKLPRSGDFYALRVSGNSMVEENIKDGDIVLVKHQSVAENGQRVVALIDGSEATLKKFYRERNQIRLQPANKSLEPIIVRSNRTVSIQGVVIDVIRAARKTSLGLPEQEKEEGAYAVLPLNQIICGDAAKVLKTFPSDSIDLVITSPPYDDIRDYKGFTYDLHATGKQIHRVLKDGGIAVMVIQDQTKNFGKTLTSFRTILDWCDSFGFKLFETVIYHKYGAEGAWWNKRFRVDHEYMPIFLKGDRPRYFDKEPLKIPSKHGGKTMTGGGTRLTNGVRISTRAITINPMKCRGTIWEYLTAGDGTRLKHQHPATFPDKLPYDFIQCFSPAKGIVLDPFIGSGTTAIAAKRLDRSYIGIDISKDYCDLAEKRIREEIQGENQSKLF